MLDIELNEENVLNNLWLLFSMWVEFWFSVVVVDCVVNSWCELVRIVLVFCFIVFYFCCDCFNVVMVVVLCMVVMFSFLLLLCRLLSICENMVMLCVSVLLEVVVVLLLVCILVMWWVIELVIMICCSVLYICDDGVLEVDIVCISLFSWVCRFGIVLVKLFVLLVSVSMVGLLVISCLVCLFSGV